MANPATLITILAVSDLPRSRAFYDTAFGWERVVDVPVYVQYRLPGGQNVAVYQAESFEGMSGGTLAPRTAGGLSGAELYLHTDDLDDAIRRLNAAGARPLSPRSPRNFGDEAAYFADPDGHLIGVGE